VDERAGVHPGVGVLFESVLKITKPDEIPGLDVQSTSHQLTDEESSGQRDEWLTVGARQSLELCTRLQAGSHRFLRDPVVIHSH
jgi:hypothetical protein